MDATKFSASELHKAAILQKLTVIGEASARLSQAFRESHPQIEWRDIIAFRNIAVHTYFSVQWDIVWERQPMTSRCFGVRSWSYSIWKIRNRPGSRALKGKS